MFINNKRMFDCSELKEIRLEAYDPPEGRLRAFNLSEGDIFQIKHKEIDAHFKIKNNKLYEVKKDDMEWLGDDEIGWLGQPTWKETGKIYMPEEINKMLFE